MRCQGPAELPQRKEPDPRLGSWLQRKEAGTLGTVHSPDRARESTSSEKTAGSAKEAASQMRKLAQVLAHPVWPQVYPEAEDDLRIFILLPPPQEHCGQQVGGDEDDGWGSLP